MSTASSTNHDILSCVMNPILPAHRIRGYLKGKLPWGPGVRLTDSGKGAETPEQPTKLCDSFRRQRHKYSHQTFAM